METTVANTVPFNDGCIIEKWKITMIVLAKPTSLLKVANNAHGNDNENNVDRDIDGKLDFNGLGMPMELMGVKTVPQLVSGDELVGGYNDVLNS